MVVCSALRRVLRDGRLVARRAAEEGAGRAHGVSPAGARVRARVGARALRARRHAVVTGRLAKLEFRGATFENTRALTHLNGDPPDLGFSPHVDGALCADLFRGCDLVLDLGNDRVAVVQRER